MDLRRLTSFAFLASIGLCAGCLHTPKPVELAKAEHAAAPSSAEAAAPTSAKPDPKDPLLGLTPTFTAFLTSQGLTAEPAKQGEAALLTAGWKHSIAYAPDPVHGGEPVPGLVARIWIFGPDEGRPIEPDGELVAGVWEMSPKGGNGKPKLMELWHIDRETAKKFRRRDAIGDGYSIFLPWSTYNVDLKQVNVMIRFNSADGRNLASSPQTLTLDHSATLERAAEKLGISGRDPGVDFSKLPLTFGPNASK